MGKQLTSYQKMIKEVKKPNTERVSRENSARRKIEILTELKAIGLDATDLILIM